MVCGRVEGRVHYETGVCMGFAGCSVVEMGQIADHGKGNDLTHYFLVLLDTKVPAFQIQINLQENRC